MEIDSLIRILKSQYNKEKSLSNTQEEQGILGAPSKKWLKCTNCKRKGHLIDTCWSKGGIKKVKVLNKNGDPNRRIKRGKTKRMQPKKPQVTGSLMNP